MYEKYLKSNIKLLYGIVVLSVMLLSLSYGIFVITSSDHKTSELMVGNLLYGITIHDTNKQEQTNPVIVGEGDTTLYITISSVNSINSKYTLAYDNNNVTVKSSNKSGWNASGSMTTYQGYAYTKTVKVVVTNNSGTNQTVTFATFGGYSYNSTSNIPLGNGYYSVANFTDVTSVNAKNLVQIVEEDTNCTSNTCIYGGEATSNYFSFEEDGDLYRVLGTYTIDESKVTKIAANTLTEVTTSSNLSTSLNTIKSGLDMDNIYSTNKFNCTGTNNISCSSSNYNDVGILSLDEYKNLEGDNESSYLYNSNEYYLLNENNLVSNTNQDEEVTSAHIRPTMYIEDNVEVTGSGTVGDPYVLEKEADVNIIAYTLNDVDVTKTMSYSQLTNGDYIINKVVCTKGAAQIMTSQTREKVLKFTSVPATCTINFIDAINIVSIMSLSTLGTRNIETSDLPASGVYETFSTIDNSTVYYYAGGSDVNNWVIFGKCSASMAISYNCTEGDYLYWRIIRTNTTMEGSGIRLLYSGSGPSGTIIDERIKGNGYIANSVWDTSIDSASYTPAKMGYWYTIGDTLTDARKNGTKSTTAAIIDDWYKTLDSEYSDKVNVNAVYCNDRSLASGNLFLPLQVSLLPAMRGYVPTKIQR